MPDFNRRCVGMCQYGNRCFGLIILVVYVFVCLSFCCCDAVVDAVVDVVVVAIMLLVMIDVTLLLFL